MVISTAIWLPDFSTARLGDEDDPAPGTGFARASVTERGLACATRGGAAADRGKG
jgi:hypothetical protein